MGTSKLFFVTRLIYTRNISLLRLFTWARSYEIKKESRRILYSIDYLDIAWVKVK